MSTLELDLHIQRAGCAPIERSFDRELVKLGTHPTCDLILEGQGVCRVHAIIERALSGDHFTVTNMAALGHTFVNGDEVTRAELRAGDELRIGDYLIQLRSTTQPDFILIDSDDEDAGMIAAPIAKVIWSATRDEMSAEPVTGELYLEEPIYLLTQPKRPKLSPQVRRRAAAEDLS